METTKDEKVIAVIGGDLRSAHVANTLAEAYPGARIHAMFLERDVELSNKVWRSGDIKRVLPGSSVVIFPLPALDSSGYINTPLSAELIPPEDCFSLLRPGAQVFAGKIPVELEALSAPLGIRLHDYMLREEFAVSNAIPTAEGAVAIALRERPVTLYGSTCMVLGYGRIGKALTRLLVAFGAEVRVVARRHSDLAWAGLAGAKPVRLPDFGGWLGGVDVLFNTVPAVLLDEDKLSGLDPGCLVIDLASKPGGVDFAAARELGVKVIWALSIPGKEAPITAGEIMLRTITNILAEEGIYLS